MMKAVASQWLGYRPVQEDTYRIQYFPEGLLVLVCDGMGGHRQGEQAAELAATAFLDSFRAGSASVEKRLSAALNAANSAVGKLVESSSLFGGTTLLAAFVGKGVLRWISVGDSALLLWRKGRLVRLNADHSLRPLLERVVSGPEKASHVLRSALTGEQISLVDSSALPLPLLPDDRVILCSDGADSVLNPAKVSSSVREVLEARSVNDASILMEQVRLLASEQADNTTILVIDV